MGVTSDDTIPIASNPDFIPILSLYANVSVVKWLQPGMTVSYGRHFTVKKPCKVATMSIGYTDVENVQEGDTVCIVGRQGGKRVTIDEISRKAHTINNETLSALAARVPRLKKRG